MTQASRRSIAASLTLCVGIGSAVLLSGATPAAAAGVRAQSVGRFVDGAAGGMAIQKVADLKDARATNPGTVTDQNPLDVTVGGQLNVPLTGAAQLPGSGNTIKVGAANQVARARSNGYAYGASGAVANSGGASVGGNNNAYPAGASIDLSSSAVATPASLPKLPGTTGLAALGAITADIGAVSALASTPAGYGTSGSTKYNIAGLTLTIASPALGGLLKTLGGAIDTGGLAAPALPSPLPAGFTLPAECKFSTQALAPVVLDNGALKITPKGGELSINVAALLRTLGLNLNSLPANTDLLADVLKYLSASNGLARGVQSLISGISNGLSAQFTRCVNAFPSPLDELFQPVLKAITDGQNKLTALINTLTKQLSSAAGTNPFAPLTNGLKQALQIGVNVQPNGPKGSYSSPLKATPDQATGVVAGQTIVRAIEVDLGGGQLSLALANAAAGPSSAVAAVRTTAPAPVSTTPAAHHPNAALPTGVPAGAGVRADTTNLPLVLLAFAILMGGAGAIAWRVRARTH